MQHSKTVPEEELEAPPLDGGGPAAEADEIARLRTILEGDRGRVVRLRADLENMRRRSAREQEAARQEGRRSALLPVLVVLDALERALAAASPDADLYEGVAATYRLFHAALREAGAKPIETRGRAFDPKVHEAIAAVLTPGVEPGTVVRELRSGWSLGGELLRPAQMEVAASLEEPVGHGGGVDRPARERG